jgi:hypothetical protein
MDKQTFTPVTFAYLRREAKWLHLYCTVCGRERESMFSNPPLDRMPDSTVVPTLGQSMVWSKCGTKGRSGRYRNSTGRRQRR